jgi:phage terminase large subunit GpA-like protein
MGPALGTLAGERRLLVPPPLVPICEWSEDNLFLPAKETTAPGLFSFHFSPFLREIAEACVDPAVAEVTVFACTQGGKTLLSYLILAYTVAVNPMHTMIVMPDRPTVRRRISGRIRPIFEANKFLLEAIGGRIENLHIGEATIMALMNLYLGWAHSAAALADVPAGLILADELGKFPPAVGKEADPMNLLRDRQRTFGHRSKLIKLTSPVDEGDLADIEYNEGDRRQYHAKCPHCGAHHIPDDRHMILDKGPHGEFLEPKQYERGDRVRYVCPGCGTVWNDYDRHAAIAAGRWAPEGCTVNKDGRIEGEYEASARRSYRISAFMVNPRFQSIAGLAAMYARAQRTLKAGNVLPLQHWTRSQMARSWRQREKEPDTNRLDEHLDTYEIGRLPAGVQVVTIGIDVQEDHIWYAVLGWGYLFEAWLIDAGRIETGDTSDLVNYEPIRPLLARPWPYLHDSKLLLPPAGIGIDCGYRGSVVEDFCRQNAHLRVVPVKGDDKVKARVYRKSPIDKVMARYHLNVNTIKDRLYRLLFETAEPGPGYFHLPAETSKEVKEQLCSEEQQVLWRGFTKQITWKPKAGGGPNHLWDCCVYATALAELMGVGRLEAPVTRPIRKPQEQQEPDSDTDSGFLDGLPGLN